MHDVPINSHAEHELPKATLKEMVWYILIAD